MTFFSNGNRRASRNRSNERRPAFRLALDRLEDRTMPSTLSISANASAIEGGNVTLRAATVDLHELVAEVCASFAAKATAHGVSLVNQVEPDVMVYADGRRLEQMLTNLIDNGIKFSREGGTVTIRHEAGSRDRIVVEDNGDGIPAQHVERLFERFYRVDRARSRDMGGTGLGLAIVKHLALLHGGEVTVDSELGKGTIFTIHLPKRS